LGGEVDRRISEKPDTEWNLSSYELMISDEIFRGRYRNSYEKPEAIVPGEITPFTIDLHTADHVFKKGHRIMVQVQSTWFPLYDRNPQKFVPKYFRSERIGLSESHREDLPLAEISIAREISVPVALLTKLFVLTERQC